jgi:uncharacterized membrane protein
MTVSELVVFVFRDQYRAPEVLNELRRRQWLWVKDLNDAVAVTLDDKGNTTAHLSVCLTRDARGSDWARIWGSLLSTTLFLPLTNGMAEAANAIALKARGGNGSSRDDARSIEEKWWTERLRLSDNFTRDVAALIRPGSSAIFMLLRTATVPVALEQLRNYGDTIVHTSLSAEEGDRTLAMLARD